MVKVSKKQVEHVAKLSNLELKKGEIDKYSKQLSDIVDSISILSEVLTSGVNPTSQTTGLENVSRVDDANKKDTLTTDEVISGSNNIHNNYFVVPMVLKERTDY